MPELPLCSAAAAASAFMKAGFVFDRKSGSHAVFRKPGHKYHLSIPVHGAKPLGKGLLRSLIADAGLTIEQFCDLL